MAARLARFEMQDRCITVVVDYLTVVVVMIHRRGLGVLMIMSVRGRSVLMLRMIVASSVRVHVQR